MEKRFELIAPCHFGLEAVLKKEVTDLGYEISQVEDGKVTFWGDEAAICRANVFLRTAERVMVKAGSFRATTFEELFQGTKALPWEDLIPEDGKFWVAKATSIKSKLFSPSDIQSIMKKAMVERLKEKYGVSWFPETGSSYPPAGVYLQGCGDDRPGHHRSLPAQAGLQDHDQQGAHHGDPGGGPASSDAVE